MRGVRRTLQEEGTANITCPCVGGADGAQARQVRPKISLRTLGKGRLWEHFKIGEVLAWGMRKKNGQG